jgi:hypothetical protein
MGVTPVLLVVADWRMIKGDAKAIPARILDEQARRAAK